MQVAWVKDKVEGGVQVQVQVNVDVEVNVNAPLVLFSIELDPLPPGERTALGDKRSEE